MKKHKLLFSSVLCVAIFILVSCTKQDQFLLLEHYDCCVYQYKTKDKYFSKYKDYHVFTDLDEVEYKEFTIFILNKKTDSMPQDLYNSLLEQFKEPKKIIFIQGDSNKIKYEEVACGYNWNSLGVIGSGVYWYGGTINATYDGSNEKCF